MKKFLFICSMFLACQSFAIDTLDAKNDTHNEFEQIFAKGRSDSRQMNDCKTGSTGPAGLQGDQGPKGNKGQRGPKGNKGEDGERGRHGERGRRGKTANPSIIPYASGDLISLVTLSEGEIQAMIGFGNAFRLDNVGRNSFSLIDNTTAFTVPRSGSITSLAANFITGTSLAPSFITVGEDQTFDSNVTVHAEVYLAPASSNIFTAQGGVDLLPQLFTLVTPAGVVSQGFIEFATPIAINPLDRVVVVFSASTGVDGSPAEEVNGFASASLTIR